MPELTRRRSTDAHEECWHIYYGDVHPSTIAIRNGAHTMRTRGSGLAVSIRSEPGEQQNGTAATFDEARADFELAWRMFSVETN